MRDGPRQLALALGHAESFAREDFLSGSSNARALALMDAWPDWPSRTMILTGPEGSGKSHLAAIWALRAGARCIAARALDLAAVPTALATGALVVEDLAAGAYDERALFHLLNLAREEDAFILLTARSAPGMPAIAVSTGKLTYCSTSTGPSAGAAVITWTWTFVTSGTASIGTCAAA